MTRFCDLIKQRLIAYLFLSSQKCEFYQQEDIKWLPHVDYTFKYSFHVRYNNAVKEYKFH